MTSHEKKRFADLEKRIRDLEARPVVYPTIIIQPAPQPAPYYPPHVPFYIGDPFLPVATPTWTVQPFLAPGTFTC